MTQPTINGYTINGDPNFIYTGGASTYNEPHAPTVAVTESLFGGLLYTDPHAASVTPAVDLFGGMLLVNSLPFSAALTDDYPTQVDWIGSISESVLVDQAAAATRTTVHTISERVRPAVALAQNNWVINETMDQNVTASVALGSQGVYGYSFGASVSAGYALEAGNRITVDHDASIAPVTTYAVQQGMVELLPTGVELECSLATNQTFVNTVAEYITPYAMFLTDEVEHDLVFVQTRVKQVFVVA